KPVYVYKKRHEKYDYKYLLNGNLPQFAMYQYPDILKTNNDIQFPAMILAGWYDCTACHILKNDLNQLKDSLPAGIHYYYLVTDSVVSEGAYIKLFYKEKKFD